MASVVPVSVKTQWRAAAALAAVAGYVDAFGLILYGTFLSFMSGNTTSTGSQIGQGHFAAAVPTLIAILGFVAGVFTGASLAHSGLPRQQQIRLWCVIALLAVVIGLSLLMPLPNSLAIALASLAMGIMNTVLSRVGGQSVNVGFVTGTLNAMANHLALAVRREPLADAFGPWDTHARRAAQLCGVWAAFLTGAAISGAMSARFGAPALVAPLLVLLAFSARLSLSQGSTAS